MLSVPTITRHYDPPNMLSVPNITRHYDPPNTLSVPNITRTALLLFCRSDQHYGCAQRHHWRAVLRHPRLGASQPHMPTTHVNHKSTTHDTICQLQEICLACTTRNVPRCNPFFQNARHYNRVLRRAVHPSTGEGQVLGAQHVSNPE